MRFPSSLFRARLTSAFLLFLSPLALTLPAQEIPSGGVSLVNPTDIATEAGFYANDTANGPVATRTAVTVTGQSFTTAAQVATLNPTGQFYSSAITASTNRAVADGDIVLLHFFMRAIETTDETGTVVLEAYFEGPPPAYTRSLSVRPTANTTWTEYFLPFRVQGNYIAGAAGIKFGFGGPARAQVLEFGGVEVLWYGTSRTLEEMPRTSFQYDGRATDAPWRAAAAQRIDTHRKGDLAITVRDAAGDPLPGATVRVRQTRHAFEFGTAVVASRLMNPGTADAPYVDTFLELFNAGTFENDLKWQPWDGAWGAAFARTQTVAALQWLQTQNIVMRGHVLVWPSVRNMPDTLTTRIEAADPTIPQVILDHIDDVMEPTTPYLTEWDVMNEPYDNYDIMETYGYEHMIDWWNRARANHPTADLYINDYAILAGGGTNTAKQDAYANTVQYLLDGGAPITGIGFQGHFSAVPTGIPRIWTLLQRYATEFPQMKFRITELDISTDDEELQADFYRDLITICMSHPQMEGVQFWGFWEGAHWRPASALFALDWTAKPAAIAYRNLVFGDWWTDTELIADQNGQAAVRAFNGDYTYTVVYGDTTATGTITLTSDGAAPSVTLDVASPDQPTIVTQPFGTTIAPGGSTTLSTVVSGNPTPAVTWYRNGTPTALTTPTISLTDVVESATYHAVATNANGSVQTRSVTIGVRAPGTQTEKLANISTRGRVGTGAAIMVAGFVINGTAAKDVVIRAVGPQLGEFGLPGTLADPRIRIFKGDDQINPIAENDDWSPDLAADFATLGAFALETDTKSAAVRLSLEPDRYTVQIAGAQDGTGLAIVEVYDAATGAPVEMVNISTRGEVGTGLNKLVAGFVIAGDVPQQVLIRGIGPTLGGFGVPHTLANPILRLYEPVPGSAARLLLTNDNWGTGDTTAITATTSTVGGFALTNGSADAALLVSLEPGSYTVELAGVADTTGIALIEVYRVP
ncbi:endo-1,4-beta-xylanase [Synoicihabitans lomoniglobus]|uniref:Beta-xylanase n=1 Tax=Synoicihabitans lomoniglobus TaxID=2909285 RepID=A0AAF0CNX6_9BACT|nr:endo-1,4-beta-xylanase [Opitutaceae bacterium LMO-M01]WED65030.1 endo-1,4-beta-xylanase [Opitutaceae bacterium LMO-M01]